MRIGETDLRFRVKRPSAGAGAAHGLAEAGRGGQGTGQPGGQPRLPNGSCRPAAPPAGKLQ
jgi:hypothetical protein